MPIRTKRRRWLPAMASLAIAVSGCGANDGSPGPSAALAMGTSSVGSAFYTLAVGISEVLSSETNISITAEPVGGSDANLRALSAGKIDLAIVNADAASAAFQGAEQFAKDGKMPVRLVAQGQLSLRQIVARADAGIRTPVDLAGKRVIMRRPALRDIDAVGRALLRAYGIAESAVTPLSTTETNDALEALKIGAADAAIVPAGVPASFLSDLSQSTDVVFLSIPDDKLSRMVSELGPAFRRGVIPAGTYRGQDADVTVPAIASVMVARADLPEETVFRIAEALFSSPERIKNIHAAAKEWTVANSLATPPLPFHPGAERYYRERTAP